MIGRVLVVLTCLFSVHAYAAMPPIGQPAPDFKAIDTLSAKPFSLSDFKGKLVVLEWNSFECPFVKKFYSTGEMQALQKNARADGIVWISINSSAVNKEGFLPSDAIAKAALSQRHAQPSHFVRDYAGTIGHQYGATSTPTMFVIDTNGLLAYEGAMDNKPSADPADIAGAANYVSEALDDLKQHHAVKITHSQPYGCFVHY